MMKVFRRSALVGSLSSVLLAPLFGYAATTTSYSQSSTVFVVNSFTSGGTTENWTVPYGVSSIDAIAVGGGGGGAWDGGNGGGGGELRSIASYAVTAGSVLSAQVGNGGAGANWNAGTVATSGSITKLQNAGVDVLVANGGSAGIGWSSAQNYAAGGTGGSGGTGSQGGQGGVNRWQQTEGIGGNGSNGPTSTLATNSTTYYGGGGGGGSCWSSINSGTYAGTSGGLGGGGGGAGHIQGSGSPAGTNGTANTGGGGGGGAACDGGTTNGSNQRTNGGNGGSGIVIIRYLLTAPSTPALPIANDSGRSNSDRVTAYTSFNLTGTAVGGSSIQIFNGASAIGSPCTANVTTGAYSCSISGLTDGTYIFSAKSSVAGGSPVASTSSITVVVDATSPSLEPSSGISVTENQTSITTITSNETVTMQMTGGVDSLTANFNTSTGDLSFKQAQDYEAPSDYNLDRVYVVRIQVTDIAGNWRYRDISITLTNVNESSSISAPAISGTINKGVNTAITVTINVAGKVRFFVGGKRISTCKERTASGNYPNYSATCIWKPSVTGRQYLTATLTPTDNTFSSSTSARTEVFVLKRASNR
jgi:hypothetical protein